MISNPMKILNRRIAEILQSRKKEKRKSFAVLLDPDKVDLATFPTLLEEAVLHQVDFFFVGGSLITHYAIEALRSAIHQHTDIPVILFPGSSLHIDPAADAILLLSLISGRNPDLLIGQHVLAAPLLKKSGIEVISTGYILVDSGKQTTASYISNTTPIPRDKPSIAACTALAGEYLGMASIFLDAGSGAIYPVSAEMITAVEATVGVPLIVGGGINSFDKAQAALTAGADVIVVGNGIEENVNLMGVIARCVREFNANSKR